MQLQLTHTALWSGARSAKVWPWVHRLRRWLVNAIERRRKGLSAEHTGTQRNGFFIRRRGEEKLCHTSHIFKIVVKLHYVVPQLCLMLKFLQYICIWDRIVKNFGFLTGLCHYLNTFFSTWQLNSFHVRLYRIISMIGFSKLVFLGMKRQCGKHYVLILCTKTCLKYLKSLLIFQTSVSQVSISLLAFSNSSTLVLKRAAQCFFDLDLCVCVSVCV